MAVGTPVVASPLPEHGRGGIRGRPERHGVHRRRAAAGGHRRVDPRKRSIRRGAARSTELTWTAIARRHRDVWEQVAGEHGEHGRRGRCRWPLNRIRSDRRPLAVAAGLARCERGARPAGGGGPVHHAAGPALAARPTSTWCCAAAPRTRRGWAPMVGAANLVAVAPDARLLRLAWEQVRLARSAGGSGRPCTTGRTTRCPSARRCPRSVTVHDLSFFEQPEWHERSKVAVFRRAIAWRRPGRRGGGVPEPGDRGARWPGGARSRPRWSWPRTGSTPAGSGPTSRSPGPTLPAWQPWTPRLDPGRPSWCSSGPSSRARTCPRWWPRSPIGGLTASRGPAGAGRGARLGIRRRRPGRGGAGLGDRIVRTGYVADEAVPALLRSATSRRLPGALRGIRAARPRGAGLRRPAGDHAGTAMEEVAGAQRRAGRPGGPSRTGRGPRRRRSTGRATTGPPRAASAGFDIVDPAHLGGERRSWHMGPTACGPPAPRGRPVRPGRNRSGTQPVG